MTSLVRLSNVSSSAERLAPRGGVLGVKVSSEVDVLVNELFLSVGCDGGLLGADLRVIVPGRRSPLGGGSRGGVGWTSISSGT